MTDALLKMYQDAEKEQVKHLESLDRRIEDLQKARDSRLEGLEMIRAKIKASQEKLGLKVSA